MELVLEMGELFRALSGAPTKRLSIDICGDDCTGALTDPLLVHGRTVEETGPKDVPWFTNLEAVRADRGGGAADELAQLRELQALAREDAGDGSKDKPPKKEKKKKKRGDDADGDDGRLVKTPKQPGGELEVGQKTLEAIYAFTVRS